MKVNINKKSLVVDKGDLFIDENMGARLVVMDGEKFACLCLVKSEIVTPFYDTIEALLDGYRIVEVIPAKKLEIRNI